MKTDLLRSLDAWAGDYRQHRPATAEMDISIVWAYCSGKSATQIAMDVPCSESTVYRAIKRVREFLGPPNCGGFLDSLREQLTHLEPNFGGSNAESVLEMLYAAYAENNEHETEECIAGFLALDAILSDLPVAISNPIFDKVCALCSCHERSGFTNGLKFGVRLGNELKL